jgi:serine/threonine protein phosphatase PrpC
MELRSRDSAIREPVRRGVFRKKIPAFESVVLSQNANQQDRLLLKSVNSECFAIVRKGTARLTCQDAALISLEDGHALMGVFDGFMELGDLLPGLVGYKLSNSWKEQKGSMSRAEDLKDLVFRAANSSLSFTSPADSGGTTAVVASILPDQRFFVASVGDSAAYYIDPNGNFRRLFSHGKVLFGDEESTSIKLDPKAYSQARNFLSSAIGSYFGKKQIKIEEGVLERGAKLVLVSDGITKNLHLTTDENGNVSKMNDCADLQQIVSGISGVEEIGDTIMNETIKRAVSKTSSHGISPGMVLLPADDDMTVVAFEQN